jgi:hypothetical protein
MCLLNVRFAPDSDRIADIAGGPSLEGYRVIRIDWGHRVVANLLARGQDLVNGLKNTPVELNPGRRAPADYPKPEVRHPLAVT